MAAGRRHASHPLTCHSRLIPLGSHQPHVHPSVFVAAGARIIGRTTIGAGSSIWFNAVLRADINRIRIGCRTNIQDLCILHVDHDAPCVVGDEVVVGHQACLHGCTVGDGALIGMGAILLNHARIGDEALVAAGALVPEGMRVPPRALVMGRPARRVRTLSSVEVRQQHRWALSYARLAGTYARNLHKSCR